MVDEYAGHANYRDQFAPKPPREVWRGFLRFFLCVGVGAAITWIVHKAIHPGQNVLVLFTAGFAAIVGLLAACFCYPWLRGTRNLDPRPLGTRDVIAAAFLMFVFAIPFSRDRARDERAAAASRLEAERWERERAEYESRRRQDGMAMLRRLGRYGPPGVGPPDFEVQDSGDHVLMTYRGVKGTSISLSRVIADAWAPGGWRACAMWTEGVHNGRYYSHYINPQMTLRFDMHRDCIPEFRGAAIEFRVGNPMMEGEAAARAWWSESAFASPGGREAETSRYLDAIARKRHASPADSAPQ